MSHEDIEEKLDALKLATRAYKVARNVEDERWRVVKAAEADLSAARDAARDATLKAATAWSIARVAFANTEIRPLTGEKMNNEDLLEFYQSRLYKKLIRMHQAERAALMMDIFGKRWLEVYDHLVNLYPQLLNFEVARNRIDGHNTEIRPR